MNLHDFLKHHGIAENPFAEEDAQTDPVFKDRCISDTYHPAWDKIFGTPKEPATSIVFGEKGAGKTALRLQVDRHLASYNKTHPKARCFVVHYDDFNPFLDHFCERFGRRTTRKPNKLLLEYQLWDHMDAILSLGVTQLVDAVIESSKSDDVTVSADELRNLDRHQRRDLMLLAAFYDNSSRAPSIERWRRLKRKLSFWTVKAKTPLLIGSGISVAVVALIAWLVYRAEITETTGRLDFLHRYGWLFVATLFAGWMPYAWQWLRRWWLAQSIARRIRVVQRRTMGLCRSLMQLTSPQLSGQPFPNYDRTDDRYTLLRKLQSILESLGYTGVIVLVDRVDEPHLINGSAELMRAFLWPMLDNKFLKQPGIGVKFMLPRELSEFIDREDREFYQRARLDKQNLIPSLDWTGEALYDVANSRLAACADNGRQPKLRDLIDESVTNQRLFDVLHSLRVPRHMFRFFHRAMVAHCNKYSGDNPVWRISNDTFESELALYRRTQEAADRGLAAG